MTGPGWPHVPTGRRFRLHAVFGALLVLGVFTLWLQMTPFLQSLSRTKGQHPVASTASHVTPLFGNGAAGAGKKEVLDDDLLHLSLLHEHCVRDASVSLPWTFGSPGNQLPNASASNPEVVMHLKDENLLAKLRQCPDVDIFLPLGLRGNGYCQDAVAYVKYLQSRLLPQWALQVKLFDPDLGRGVDYFDLCPKTPMLFFNHYWNGVPSMPRWPKDKPIYMMPNIDMFEITAVHYWQVDAVLCKTRVCYDRVTQWYEQEGNPRGARVFYTKHTSSDPATFARKRLGKSAIVPKDFATIKLVHTAGTSASKGTRELVECWVHEPDLPPLDVYIDSGPFNRLIKKDLKASMQHSRSPLNLTVGMVERSAFAKLTAEAAFHMCPSISEGYGHYINQARAAGAVVITTDLPPMNELISSGETGFLIPVKRRANSRQLMGGEYKGKHGLKGVSGLLGSFGGPDVCKAVRELVENTTTKERAAMGAKAHRAYHEDTHFFARAMEELRQHARGSGLIVYHFHAVARYLTKGMQKLRSFAQP
ncbi:unnamed protein product [Hyaloperonospora brassicae]|uniref:Glycosyl transferase family 1 domain-containing protein n=1 Tax=Hyaloperonospora brassicae TaxID=162125 RepID=A0AAV0ULI9_HYABA|nr:unnamed protein product [Hyaloperonospora brassicae]